MAIEPKLWSVVVVVSSTVTRSDNKITIATIYCDHSTTFHLYQDIYHKSEFVKQKWYEDILIWQWLLFTNIPIGNINIWRQKILGGLAPYTISIILPSDFALPYVYPFSMTSYLYQFLLIKTLFKRKQTIKWDVLIFIFIHFQQLDFIVFPRFSAQ